jgi:hypothetical protein
MERKIRYALIGGMLCLSIFSCKSKEQKLAELKEKMIPILTSELTHKYSVKVDSIKIFKIDTLSDSLYNELRTNVLYDKMQKYMDKRQYYFGRQKDLDNEADEAYDAAHMELYTPDEAQFRQSEMDTYSQRWDEAKDYQNIVQKYSDTLNVIAKEIGILENKAKITKLNKRNFLGYFVQFHFIGADTNNSQMDIDSVRYCISPTFRIMQLDKL